jgi:hypothetical protein
MIRGQPPRQDSQPRDNAHGGVHQLGGTPQCPPLRAIIAPSKTACAPPRRIEETISFDEGMWDSDKPQIIPAGADDKDPIIEPFTPEPIIEPLKPNPSLSRPLFMADPAFSLKPRRDESALRLYRPEREEQFLAEPTE